MFKVFKSKDHYDNYVRCIDAIEIGDSVECVLKEGGSLFSGTNANLILPGNLRFIFPIIGRDNNISNGAKYHHTMIGIPRTNTQLKCGYASNNIYWEKYHIERDNRHLYIYCNSNMDIFYTRIIKRKK